jgi:hypothetical protein
MATLLTYSDGNLIDSVTKLVINMSPIDTPIMSGIAKKKISQIYHQWPEHSLSARGSNAKVEGSTVTYGTRTAPSRRTNYTQIISQEYSVSSSEIAAKGAGIDNMLDYQKANALKELSNDIEWNLINATLSAGTATEARQMGGLLQYITTNATTYASTVKLVETIFVDLLQKAWDSGARADVCWVPSYMKNAIAAFSANSVRNIDADTKKLVNNVSIYESPYGAVAVELVRDIPNATDTARVVVAQRDKLAMGILRPVAFVDDVAQTIRGKNGFVDTEVTLEITEKACAQAIGFSIEA